MVNKNVMCCVSGFVRRKEGRGAAGIPESSSIRRVFAATCDLCRRFEKMLFRAAPFALLLLAALPRANAGGSGPSPPVRTTPAGDLDVNAQTGAGFKTCTISAKDEYCMYKIPSAVSRAPITPPREAEALL